MNRLRRAWGRRALVRKLLAILTATLTACTNMRVEPMSGPRQAEIARRGESVVLLRFAGQRDGIPFSPLADTGGFESPRVVFRDLDTGTTFRSPTDLNFPAPSEDAAKAGWAYFLLPPGSYYLGLNTSLGDLRSPNQGLHFVVPAHSSVAYIGTFRISCSGSAGATSTCQAQAGIDDESGAAAEVAATNFAAVGSFVTEIAAAYEAPSVGKRLPPAAFPAVAFGRAEWRLRREQDEPPPPKPASTQSSYSSGGGGGGSFFNGCGGGPGCGALLLAILVVAGTIYAVDQIDKALAEPERKPCTDALGQAVTVDRLKPLLTGFAFDGDTPPAAASIRWEASVSRVMLRKCTTGDTYGIEVAARWRAAETDTGRPSFDAVLVSAPQSPASDKRVPHPWDRNTAIPPWEIPLPSSSSCRALAEYCAPGGSDLVLQDIADGLQRMRMWLAGKNPPPGASAPAPPSTATARSALYSAFR